MGSVNSSVEMGVTRCTPALLRSPRTATATTNSRSQGGGQRGPWSVRTAHDHKVSAHKWSTRSPTRSPVLSLELAAL
eukprot:2423113-Prymnesium_polylepis.1